MNKRLQVIVSEIPTCLSFADVGCDHGYVAKSVLDCGKCSNVTVSDISAPSLEKAKRLLAPYVASGKVKAVVCDGLSGYEYCQVVLIAGMGGEETVKILSEAPFKPQTVVLSPMKNQSKVRRYLEQSGYGIVKDYTIYDSHFYHIMVAELGFEASPYSDAELEFGRTNLKERQADFIAYLKKELEKARSYEKKVVSPSDKKEFERRITALEELLNEN